MDKCGEMIVSNEKMKNDKVQTLINKGFAVRVFLNDDNKYVIRIYR